MRFIEKENLFFLHIPKCAGLGVGKALAPFSHYPYAEMAGDLGIDLDRTAIDRLLDGAGYPHPVLGRIHPAHIPLAMLEAHFPQTWTLFSRATSFALIRDPRTRFISALMQRLIEHKRIAALHVEDGILQEEAAHVCGWLDGRRLFADLEYVHFTRQIDYTHLEDVRRVARIFPLERTGAMVAWLASHGIAVELKMHHARRQPQKWFKGVQPVVRFLARNGLPGPVRRAIYPLWMKSGFFDTASAHYDKRAFSPDIEAFIARYYADDAALHRQAQEEAAAQGPLHASAAEG